VLTIADCGQVHPPFLLINFVDHQNVCQASIIVLPDYLVIFYPISKLHDLINLLLVLNSFHLKMLHFRILSYAFLEIFARFLID